MKSFLIDTNILIWHLIDSEKLSKNISLILNDPENKIYVSIVSLWEIAIKKSIGKLEITKTMKEIENDLIFSHFELLPVKVYHLHNLETLPFHHRDPFDRLILSTSISENFHLITNDDLLKLYKANIIFN